MLPLRSCLADAGRMLLFLSWAFVIVVLAVLSLGCRAQDLSSCGVWDLGFCSGMEPRSLH